ncbi:MAG: SMC-Scp complex subunit ScpB [archaeon]
MADKDFKNQIEALLFSSGRVMDAETLLNLIGASNKQVIISNINKLKQEYEERDSPLMIVEENESWKINVRERYLPLVRKIVGELELPKTILETLAVIAWRSPVVQSVVIDIRHNKAYDHIAELEELGFISKEKKGRSFVLKVTNKFFEYFEVEGNKGLKDIFKEIQMSQKKDDKIGPLVVYNEDNNMLKGSSHPIASKSTDESVRGEHLGPLEVYAEENADKKSESLTRANLGTAPKKEEKDTEENKDTDDKEDTFGVGLNINDDIGSKQEAEDAEDSKDVKDTEDTEEKSVDESPNGLEEERHSDAVEEDLFGKEEKKEKRKSPDKDEL